MPTYVYECSSCKITFEADQRITEPPLDTCECGSVGTVKRVIQPVGISFRGSGFYVNDSVKATNPVAKPEPAATPEATPAPAPAAAPATPAKSE